MLRVKDLGFVIRHVPDIEAAKAFYRDALGLAIEGESPDFVQFANSGGATFALGPVAAGEPIELWWYVDDADAAHAALRQAGVAIVEPPTDQPFGRSLVVKDPAGNNVYLLQLPAGQ